MWKTPGISGNKQQGYGIIIYKSGIFLFKIVSICNQNPKNISTHAYKTFVSDQIIINVNKLKFTQNLRSDITSRILFFKDGLIRYFEICKFKQNTHKKN